MRFLATPIKNTNSALHKRLEEKVPELCLVTSELHITIDEGEEVIAVLTRNHLIPLKLEEDNGGSDINGDEEIPSSNEAAPRYNLRPRQTSKERQKHRPAGV